MSKEEFDSLAIVKILSMRRVENNLAYVVYHTLIIDEFRDHTRDASKFTLSIHSPNYMYHEPPRIHLNIFHI